MAAVPDLQLHVIRCARAQCPTKRVWLQAVDSTDPGTNVVVHNHWQNCVVLRTSSSATRRAEHGVQAAVQYVRQ